MKNNENILEQILLNMRYNPSLTLSENRETTKKIISEACIPKTAEPTAGDRTIGKQRFKNYPELGTWGDGRCLCAGNQQCLEYKKDCCKKTPKIEVDPLERLSVDMPKPNNFISEKSWDGGLLTLPKNAKIIKKTNCGNSRFAYNENYEKIKEDFPIFLKACKTQNKSESEINNCLKQYFDSWIGKCSDQSVYSFELDGLTYTPCFSIGGEDGVWKPAEELKVMGYFGKNNNTPVIKNNNNRCEGVRWEGFENYKDPQAKQTEDSPSDNENAVNFDLDSEGTSKGKYKIYLSGGEE
jgi:hypothetical protein